MLGSRFLPQNGLKKLRFLSRVSYLKISYWWVAVYSSYSWSSASGPRAGLRLANPFNRMHSLSWPLGSACFLWPACMLCLIASYAVAKVAARPRRYALDWPRALDSLQADKGCKMVSLHPAPCSSEPTTRFYDGFDSGLYIYYCFLVLRLGPWDSFRRSMWLL